MIQKPHNNNNYDYNDYNDDDYNTIIISRSGQATSDDSDLLDSVPDLASPSASLGPLAGGDSHTETLPAAWTYAKVSLFDNADIEEIRAGKRKLKLALSVKSSKDGKFKQFTASMNSPFRNLKRGLSSDEYAGSHYQKLISLYQDAKESADDVAVSKFHITGDKVKGRTVKRLSAILIALPTDGQYLTVIVAGNDVIYFPMSSKDLTSKQRKQGAIAQAYISSGIVKSPDLDDLF